MVSKWEIRFWGIVAALALIGTIAFGVLAHAETREIGAIPYKWHLTGDDKIVVEVANDPKVAGVVCYWAAARLGGISGKLGLADDPPEASLACRQVGPIRIREKFGPQENIAKESRNAIGFKTMQVVRMCDKDTNSLIYLVYTDEIFNGFPHNSISAVPIMGWGGYSDVQKCTDFLK